MSFRIVYFAVFLLSYSYFFPQRNKKMLEGKHWAGKWNNLNCDTMTLQAHKKYKSDYYQWGGCAEGWDFVNDSVAQKYYNVFCSSESDPKTLFTSKWNLRGDTLEIDSYNMNEKYFIVSLRRSELKLKIIKLYAKELHERDSPPEKNNSR